MNLRFDSRLAELTQLNARFNEKSLVRVWHTCNRLSNVLSASLYDFL